MIFFIEIEKIPNSFSKYWQDNFLVTSLNGRKIYRIKFDNNYTKIIFSEKIFIGERIRDIVYLKNLNAFMLALEFKAYHIGRSYSPD